jgi:hypothetical protein
MEHNVYLQLLGLGCVKCWGFSNILAKLAAAILPLPRSLPLKMVTARFVETLEGPQHLTQPNPESQSHACMKSWNAPFFKWKNSMLSKLNFLISCILSDCTWTYNFCFKHFSTVHPRHCFFNKKERQIWWFAFLQSCSCYETTGGKMKLSELT